MGCGASTPVDKVELQANKNIDKMMRNAAQVDQKIIKMLLLGAGESGKTTVFRQMRVLHSKPYSPEEIDLLRCVIVDNIFLSINTLIDKAKEFELALSPAAEAASTEIKAYSDRQQITPAIAKHVATVWADPSIQATFERRSEFQLYDSTPYYMERLQIIAAPGFSPTQEDIMRSRKTTTGVVQEKFVVNGAELHMFDVGGQRNERKKWIHCFDNVTSVIFVAALSEYDLTLFEDSTTNRMDEALRLFDSIVNNPYFVKTAMILFLNKKDLFESKMKTVPLGKFYPEYTGGPDAQAGMEFIKNQYMAKNRTPGKNVYPHFTCATDTESIKHVMKAVMDFILQQNMSDSGFL